DVTDPHPTEAEQESTMDMAGTTEPPAPQTQTAPQPTTTSAQNQQIYLVIANPKISPTKTIAMNNIVAILDHLIITL
ncbi:MAG: hypothetical protein J6W36_08190, partial [Clostridiales bacterium]|nr:hypothetical protein [Clostridiales bacterium]